MGLYGVIQKNEIMTVVGKWIQLEVIMLNRINQTWKDKYIFFLIVGIILIYGYTHIYIYVYICVYMSQNKERS